MVELVLSLAPDLHGGKADANENGRTLRGPPSSASLSRSSKRSTNQPLVSGDINIQNFTLAGMVECFSLILLQRFERSRLLKMAWPLGQPTYYFEWLMFPSLEGHRGVVVMREVCRLRKLMLMSTRNVHAQIAHSRR